MDVGYPMHMPKWLSNTMMAVGFCVLLASALAWSTPNEWGGSEITENQPWSGLIALAGTALFIIGAVKRGGP